MLPIELLVHAAVVNADLPYLLKVAVLTVTATILVIWVAEPSASRLLRSWLHAPALHRRRRLESAPALWRARITLQDEPGALERITRHLARLSINILSIHVHPVDDGVLDEFVLSTPGSLSEHELIDALESAGARSARVRPTTVLALEDGQTKALSLAARVAGNPAELPSAVAELLSARVVDPLQHPDLAAAAAGRTVLKIPSAWHGPVVFARPGEPFTPAESARASRLAELAETIEVSSRAGNGKPETAKPGTSSSSAAGTCRSAEAPRNR